ncbi:hypothetical protein HK096_010274 [Nowakowskiella sp. JEL0078]|nr:hypothetical protein HK096_010274 [Nowakowskiella sp. JEL0078]
MSYSIVALINLYNDLVLSNCNLYSHRLTSSLNSSSLIKAAIVKLPAIYDTSTSRDIYDLNAVITGSKIPTYQFDNDAYDLLASKTKDTLSSGDSSSNNPIALFLNIIIQEAITASASSTNTFQYLYVASAIVLVILVPVILLIQWRQRTLYVRRLMENMELQRMERDLLELENFRRTGAVVNETELATLEIKKVSTLGLEVVEVQEKASQNLNLRISGEKIVGIKKLFRKSIPVTFSEIDISVSTNSSCSICLESMKVADTYRQLYCSHLFHVDCIDMWLLKRSRYCPLCRIDVVQGIHEDEAVDSTSIQEVGGRQIQNRSSSSPPAILLVNDDESV